MGLVVMLPTLLELSTLPRGRLRLMPSPTTPPTDMVLEPTVMVPVLMEPMVPDMPVVMPLTAPLLEFISMDWPLLLPQLWPEVTPLLAATVPTVLVLFTVPR